MTRPILWGAGGGGAGGGGVASVATVANSAGADEGVGLTPGGALLFVQSLQRYFSLDTNTNQAADGLTVLTANGATRKWIWLAEVQNQHWANAWAGQTVVVNSGTGSDENDGVTNPLATVAELTRRLRYAKLQGTLTVTTTALGAGDGPTWVRTDPNGFNITFNGVRTSTRSSTLTGATATQNPAAGGGGAATILGDISLANWTADLNSLMRITSGARSGTCCWVMKDTGGGGVTARGGVTRLQANAGATGAADPIANTDPYNIENPQSMVFGSHQFNNTSRTTATITYNDYDMLSGGSVAFIGLSSTANNVTLTFVRCRQLATNEAVFRLQDKIFVNFNQCLFVTLRPGSSIPATLTFTGCSFIGAGGFANGDHAAVQGDCYFQASGAGNGLIVDGVDGSLNIAGSTGCFDGTNPVAFRMGGRMTVNVAGLLWGQGGTGVGLNVISGIVYIRTGTVPTVTGTGGDFSVNTAATFRAFNEAAGVYGAATNCTWANLPALGTMAMDVKGMTGIGLAN